MDQKFIKSLNDEELIQSTERVVETERKVVQVLIWHLQEIQDRRVYIPMGYESLYECLIGHFNMSDTTAYGRIKVLKILEDVPEISESLKTGALNISNIALAHSFIERHQKSTGSLLSSAEKTEILDNLKNKTTAEAKEFFARCDPEMALPHDEIRILIDSHAQLRSTVKKEFIEKINYLKSLISHENINPTHEELLTLAFDALIEKTEKKKGIHQAREKIITDLKKSTQSLTDGSSRYIARSVKRYVLGRSGRQCEHVHSSGERCTSKFQLQFDHIKAFSKGGKATRDNMQLLCRVHNAYKQDH